MKNAISIAAICLGAVLLLLSAVWGYVFPATNSWTPERAAERSALSDEVHVLMFQAVAAQENPRAAKGDPAQIQAEYREKKARLAELDKEFKSIKDTPQTTSSYFRWIGIGLVAVGAIAMKVLGEA